MDTGSGGGGDGGGGADGDDPIDNTGDSSSVGEVLSAFRTSPVGFILGVILNRLVGGLETVTVAIVDAISVVFVGSGPGLEGDKLGIADIPLYFGTLLAEQIRPSRSRADGTFGDAVLTAVQIPVDFVVSLAGRAGPLEPVVLAAGAAGGMIAVAWILRQLLVLGADAIPGAGVLLP